MLRDKPNGYHRYHRFCMHALEIGRLFLGNDVAPIRQTTASVEFTLYHRFIQCLVNMGPRAVFSIVVARGDRGHHCKKSVHGVHTS